jgi:hypothetical protein
MIILPYGYQRSYYQSINHGLVREQWNEPGEVMVKKSWFHYLAK